MLESGPKIKLDMVFGDTSGLRSTYVEGKSIISRFSKVNFNSYDSLMWVSDVN